MDKLEVGNWYRCDSLPNVFLKCIDKNTHIEDFIDVDRSLRVRKDADVFLTFNAALACYGRSGLQKRKIATH